MKVGNDWQAAAERSAETLSCTASVAAAARSLAVGDAHWPELLPDWKYTKQPINARHSFKLVSDAISNRSSWSRTALCKSRLVAIIDYPEMEKTGQGGILFSTN